ncbi:unnamed protein product [Miscanthus lutarioriparius]|uniref:G-patch domain-containing protein n=1 Tax=Miscanthus lutarioriparius TaxID=422564 RepID=A0A811PB38_9POAL|nr:unnamed protein product [Miscanthus lutarioriparius]
MDGGFEDGRARARRTRHDALYRILAECDTDYDSGDDNGSRRRKRRRDASAEPDLSKPVQFVSSGSVMPSRNPGPGPVSATAEEDEAKAGAEEVGIEPPLPTKFGKIRQGAGASREKKERERAAAARRTQASVKPPPAAPGSVRSNAKVVEMTRIMRYVDGMGLGKDGQGITEPVAVTERHKNAGLGYGEEPVTQSAKENLPPPASASTKEWPPRWSKKARARKAPVLTKNALPAMLAEQVLEEEAEGHPTVVQKVIDRRGRQERVLTDLRGLNDEQGQEMQADDAPMPELQHNVRLLVDDTEADVVRLDGQLRREHEKAASLVREEIKLSKQEAAQKRQLQVMETIAGALEQVRMDDSAGVLTLEGLLLAFRGLKARFAEEFKMCGMAWVACQFAHKLLIRFFQGWRPLVDPSVGLELMSSWKDLLEGDQLPYDFSHGAASMAVRAARVRGHRATRANVRNQFVGSKGSETNARLSQDMGAGAAPRCASVDTGACGHAKALGRRGFMGSTRGEGADPCLGAPMVADARAKQHRDPVPCHPNVFDSAVREDLVARYIVPKLRMALQEFQINPADQKLDQFRCVMLWASTIPVRCMVRFLEVDFFSKWHQVLYHWLCSPNPDFVEIVNWYKCWKDSFPPELLADARIRMLFTLGLEMMDRAAEGLEVVQPGTGENMAYLRGSGTEKLQVDAAEKASQFPCCHAV